MSLYSERLAVLKKEISIISNKKSGRKKSKKFKPHQKEMIKFIHSEITKVEFKVNDKVIILEKGDSKKGFRHILEKHYKPNDLETMDILNLPIIFKEALKLNNEGVSNKALTTYINFKNQKKHKLVVNEITNNKLVVTAYRKQ
ncbi:hypothetical protein CPG37_04540 [Malaciobacter canalis]|uniref:Phage-Barnase-EndoU-ColicinE5/D-RelE like nuclease 3 domain-containing protein n=1 Tax=Malaciobacter canalis TaxID=1912871 RepID=A0ABX4LQT4_9BACT|nr:MULTISPECIES: hypothetical protein [Malaciobacter]PHO10320.1 hypothetical protein CPG37_04540 [Malaciobacter canalis]QEE32425.1 hypothetical protein ACAN_0936 [Malaciobacter canalis]RYA23906.1 hypothetical protein CRU96_05725 [Malaciobacter halophilus]